jgi:hypothetical protein
MHIKDDMMRIDLDLRPYLMTDSIDHEQMVLWCKAYPHAENKARKLGFYNFYLTEMGRDTHEAYFDSLADYVENLRHKPGSSSWARVKDGMQILPFDDEHPTWFYRTAADVTAVTSSDPGDLLPPYQARDTYHGLLTYRVRVTEEMDMWEARCRLQDDEESGHTDIVSTDSEAFFAYLNVKTALDRMGVKGFIEPEFWRMGEGRGFYGLPSEQERMPLKANGGS